MLRQSRRQGQRLLLCHPLTNMDLIHHHGIARQGAGFVKHHGIHSSQRLEGIQASHQHAASGQGPRS